MGLLSTEVEIRLHSSNVWYFDSLGYDIPRRLDGHKKMRFKNGTKIKAKVEDLQENSSAEVTIKCDLCQKIYNTTYHNYNIINHNGETYCRPCAKKLFNSGENNPCYKKEISQEERENKRMYYDYFSFVRRVLARDNYTCQCCGKECKNGTVEVHHLDGYNWCIEKRTDDTNGITLCSNCHSNFHSIYGNGDNTKEQFEEWIGYSLKLLKFDGEITPTRMVYCYEEDKVYNSASEFAITHKLKSASTIYHVCNRDKNCITVKNMHLFWYDEYLNMTEEEIQKHINYKYASKKQVICITTKKIFNSIAEAERYYKCGHGISGCCKGKYKYYGKLPDGTRLQWMYYEDYLNTNKENDNEKENGNK